MWSKFAVCASYVVSARSIWRSKTNFQLFEAFIDCVYRWIAYVMSVKCFFSLFFLSLGLRICRVKSTEPSSKDSKRLIKISINWNMSERSNLGNALMFASFAFFRFVRESTHSMEPVEWLLIFFSPSRNSIDSTLFLLSSLLIIYCNCEHYKERNIWNRRCIVFIASMCLDF